MKRCIAVLAAVLAMPACQEWAPTAAVSDPRFAAVEAVPGQLVVGGGTYVRAAPEGTLRGTYAFRAQRDGAGQVTGSAEIHFASSDARVHIDIQCLASERNLAWLSGPVTSSNDPGFPTGRVLLWQVQDNGDGGAVYPDRISAFAWNSETNYAADVCQLKPAMTLNPWENGNVRILAPGSMGFWDMVGTWDVTKFVCINAANPADSQNLAGSDQATRQTIAPNGRFTTIWWTPAPPGEIIENTRGWMDVVDGKVRVYGGEPPYAVIEYTPEITGNVLRAEFDGNICHWDDDDQEDPSHVIMESRRKLTGVLVDDVAGTWDATMWRYTSVADPSKVVDQVAQGIGITLTLGLDSHYTLEFRVGGQSLVDEVDVIFDGDRLLARRSEGGEGSAYSGTFELKGDTWSFSGLADNDFDGDPSTPPEPAMLEAVLVRR